MFGIQHVDAKSFGDTSIFAAGVGLSSTSSRSSPKLDPRPSPRHRNTSSEILTDLISSQTDQERSFIPIIARVSAHSLRLEREYHLGKAFIQTVDPDCNHTVRLISLTRLPGRQGDARPLAVEIFESPGRNYLRDLTDFGPAWYVSKHQLPEDVRDGRSVYASERQGKISLSTFLEFAIGASECLELLHHGLKVVHGELRADAFHFNQDTGAVKLVNFGSGPRSFEHAGGLTSSGWLTLSRQTGIKNRLMFIAPEQTGRMSAEPDYRTDIYSLGILFWTMLAGEPAYNGLSAMDIMQAVLGKRLQPISNIRLDVPDVLSSIIQRMTQKQIDDRYHSVSGLKHDLLELKRLLGEGDSEALIRFRIGSKDVSSSFVLPTTLLGRYQERKRIMQAVERVAARQQGLHQVDASRMDSITSTTASSLSDRYDVMEGGTRLSDVSSQEAKDTDTQSALDSLSSSNVHDQGIVCGDVERSDIPIIVDKPPLETNASLDSVDSVVTADSQVSSGTRHSYRTKALNTINSRRPQKLRYGQRRRCEVITIYGQAGLGKSSLIQTAQGQIRKLGYFTSAKFDPARKVPFETMLRAMGSLLRQIFSESDIQTPYHTHVRTTIRPVWPSLCRMLDLPENLVSMEPTGSTRPRTGHSMDKALQVDTGDTASSFSAHSSGQPGLQSIPDFLYGGSNAYSSKLFVIFLDVVRILATGKMICLSFDDVQFADEECVDLICNILSRKLGLVIIVCTLPSFSSFKTSSNTISQLTCREAEQIPKPIKSILDNGTASLSEITLRSLTEEEVIDYVASTLSRPPDYVHSLAVVCLEKTSGYVYSVFRKPKHRMNNRLYRNPFYLKQMLEVCYRKGCLWYSWKNSAWEFDLDRVFAEFESDKYGDQLNTSFILKRLQDLPRASRVILAWGSLIGITFSFPLVQRLLYGEFDHIDDSPEMLKPDCPADMLFSSKLVDTAVEGLQAATQAYILIPTGDENLFRYAGFWEHDDNKS